MSDLYKQNENAPDMLWEKDIKRFAEVWTADDKPVGQAIRLHHRTHDINPALKMYETYLESNSVKMGGPVFIPTDFITHYDPASGKVLLAVDMRTVQRETWDRTPDFIAHRTSKVEELPA